MSPASIWEQDRLVPKQLPSLQELVRSCDEALLTRVIVDDHAARMEGRPPSLKRRRAMERRFAKTLSSMRSLPVKKKAGRALVLMPEESFVLHAGSLLVERRLGASLVSFDDVRRLAHAIEAGAAAPGGSGKDLSAEFDAVFEPFADATPPRRAYALAPWELTLACKVWLGGPWCRRERYLVIASALWEMTYFGFEYDRVVARQARARGELLVGDGLASGEGGCTVGAPCGSAERAGSFDLAEPDRFEGDYRDRLAVRVAELNEIAHVDFQARCVDLARRIGER